MKNFSLLIAITFLFVSCGSKNNSESFYIPKDAIGLMYINVKSLSEKSNDLDFKKLNLNKLIEDNAPSKVKSLMNDLMTAENMNKTFRKEFIFGFGSIQRMSGFGGLVLPIKDGASFEAFIKPIIEELPELEKQENVGKNEAFTIYSIDEMAIGWNNETALIIGAKSHAATELIDLTTIEKDKSILSTDYYNSFFNPKKDMGLYITTNSLGSTFDGLITMATGIDANLENNSLTYYGSFEDDHIHSLSNLKLNDDFKSLLGYEDWMSNSFENDLLDVVPEDIIVLAKLSLDPKGLHDHIKSLQNNKLLPANVREKFADEYENANEEIEKEMGMSIKEFANILDGSMLFAISEGITVKDTIYEYNYYSYNKNKADYEVVDKKIPYMYGAIALEDKEGFEKFFNKILEENNDIEKISENYYQLENDVQLVYNDDLIFITNDLEKALEVSKEGELDDNLSGFDHKSKLSNTLYMYSKGNISSLSQTLAAFANPYNRYSRTSTIDDMTEEISGVYEKYFGENHYYMNADGTETYTYTKGDKNSLEQSILYADEIAKLMVDSENKSSYDNNEEDIFIEETNEGEEVEIEETIIESTEVN